MMKPNGQQTSDVYEKVVYALETETLEVLNITNEPSVEAKLVAEDARPLGLKRAESIDHAVSNDNWLKVSAKEIQTLVKVAELNARKGPHSTVGGKRLYWIRAVLILFLGLSLVFLFGISTHEKSHDSY